MDGPNGIKMPPVARDAYEGKEGKSDAVDAVDAVMTTTDFSSVHRSMIPGIWNRVRFDTFPENYVVLSFNADEEGPVQRKVVIEKEGPGGLRQVVAALDNTKCQFCGFRLTYKCVRTMTCCYTHTQTSRNLDERSAAWRS
jgi:hypothetical protein